GVGAFDTTSTAADNSTSPVTGTSTTRSAKKLLFGCLAVSTNISAPSITAGPTDFFTGLAQNIAVGNNGETAAYRTASVKGSYSTSWTMSAAKNWVGGLLALRASQPKIVIRGGGVANATRK